MGQIDRIGNGVLSAERIVGGYRLLSPLVDDGWASTHHACHTVVDRQITITVIAAEHLAEQARSQIINRLRRSAVVHHPHLIRMHDVEDDEQSIFVTMEPVDGNTLADCVSDDGPIPEDLVYTIIRQLAQAMDCIHRAGMFHHRVCPRSVLLNADGDVKVLNFGIAFIDSFAPKGACQSAATINGDARDCIGPELRFDSPSNRIIQDDMFAIGRVAQFLLTGNSTGDISNCIDSAWHGLLPRMVAQSPSHRFASMAQLIEQLDIDFGRQPSTDAAPLKEAVSIYSADSAADPAIGPPSASFWRNVGKRCLKAFGML